MSNQQVRRPKCADPMNVHGDKACRSNLRPVSVKGLEKYRTLRFGDYLCHRCRISKSDDESHSTEAAPTCSAEVLVPQPSSSSAQACSARNVVLQESSAAESLAEIEISVTRPGTPVQDKAFEVFVGHTLATPEVVHTPLESPKSQDGKCNFFDESSLCLGKLKSIMNLSTEERTALSWSSGHWKLESSAVLCDKHFGVFIGDYQYLGDDLITTFCCNPFKTHKKPISSDLRKISLIAVMKGRDRGIFLKAGEMYCKNCRLQILNLSVQEPSEELSQGSIPSSLPTSDSSGGVNLSPAVQKASAVSDLASMGLKGFQTSARSKAGRVREAKRKFDTLVRSARAKLCVAFDLQLNDLCSDESIAAEEHHTLMEEVKESLKNATYDERYKLLSLHPKSWSVSKAAEYFNVSRYVINKAKSLRAEKGILSEAQPRGGIRVLADVRKRVVDFYNSEDNSRMLPGKKDFVSIGRNKHVQKRLLLDDLRNLYDSFKKESANQDVKIGFSLFCSLRPKWCILAGQPGTHSVCVCQTHQDIKLLLHALQIKTDYKTLIHSIVCDLESRSCMLGICEKCCSLTQIQELIGAEVRSQVGSLNTDDELENLSEYLEENVEYKMWMSTDRTELVSRVNTRQEVIEITAAKFKLLIPHHYVSLQQSSYVKQAKEKLDGTKVLVLMDFSMNHSCLLQDEIQSYHWSKKQATVHPVVIYYKHEQEGLQHQNLCFISDDINHDSFHVKKIQSQTVQYIKEKFPSVKYVEYITDGAASQYKNKKMFYSLCQHKKIFGLTASHTFFATSHGKSPCDGLGGTIKRKATRASLQRPLENQITDAFKLYEFCCSDLSDSIDFIFINKGDIEADRELEKENPITILPVPGTRSFHNFIPITEEKIGCKTVSNDSEYSLIHSLIEVIPDVQISIGDFVAVKVARRRYIAFVSDKYEDEGEVDLSLLYPCLPAKEFRWPEDLRSVAVPVCDIIQKVTVTEDENKICLSEGDAQTLCRKRKR